MTQIRVMLRTSTRAVPRSGDAGFAAPRHGVRTFPIDELCAGVDDVGLVYCRAVELSLRVMGTGV